MYRCKNGNNLLTLTRLAIVAVFLVVTTACNDSSDQEAWEAVDARLRQAVAPTGEGLECDTACGFELRFGRADQHENLPWYDLWYDKVFGDWERDRRVAVASASKWLSAAAIMTLVDDGWLALDAPISTYWPGLGAPHANITLRQLLSHTSGISHQHPCVNDQVVQTLQQCAQAILSMPLVDEPGTIFLYGATGFQVAGAIAERVSGVSWAQLFRERLGRPLGMDQTAYGASSGDFEDTQNPRIAGGAITTATDHYAFLTMMANRGEYFGVRILSEAAWEEMRRDYTNGVARFECPLPENECHAVWTGAGGFGVGNPVSGRVPYGLGTWLFEIDGAGRGVLMSSPGAWGTHGWIDTRRNYQGLLMMHDTYDAKAKTLFDDLIEILNTRVPPAAPVDDA